MERYIKDKQLEFDFGEPKTPHLEIGDFYQFCIDNTISYKVFGDGRKTDYDKAERILEVNPIYSDSAFSVAYEFIGHYADTVRNYVLSPHQQVIVTNMFYEENKKSIDSVVDSILNKRFEDVERLMDEIGD